MHQHIAGIISQHMVVGILYTHIRFMKGELQLMTITLGLTSPLGLEARRVPRDTLPYKARFQPYGSWFALIATGIMIVFKGFDTFILAKDEPFKTPDFISYVETSHFPSRAPTNPSSADLTLGSQFSFFSLFSGSGRGEIPLSRTPTWTSTLGNKRSTKRKMHI
jgi:hypothetical protein